MILAKPDLGGLHHKHRLRENRAGAWKHKNIGPIIFAEHSGQNAMLVDRRMYPYLIESISILTGFGR